MNIVLELAITPMGKERPRLGRGRRAFTPKRTDTWMQDVGRTVKKELGRRKLGALPDKPLRVDVVAVFPRLDKHNKRKKGKLKYSAGLIYRHTAPDRDNIDKIVLDALKTVIKNDARVVVGLVAKFYCELHGGPRIIIRITDNLPKPIAVIAEVMGKGTKIKSI